MGEASEQNECLEWNNVSLFVARILVFLKARSLRSLALPVLLGPPPPTSFRCTPTALACILASTSLPEVT